MVVLAVGCPCNASSVYNGGRAREACWLSSVVQTLPGGVVRGHTSAKLIEIKIKFLQPKHSPHGTVRQMKSNETPHTPWGLRHL